MLKALNNPVLSVVIPTVGRSMVLRTIASILAANRSSELEIIVSGAVSMPETAERLMELMRQNRNIVHLPVSFESGDSSAKKNAGWRAARAEIIAFVDDDVVVGKDWPEKILEPFQNEAVGLVSGPGLVPEDIPLIGKLAGWTLASRAAGYVAERYAAGQKTPQAVKWSRLIGCNMAYRRGVLDEINGFDVKFWPGEEMIAAYLATARKGWTLVFQPQAVLYHYPRMNYGKFLRQMCGYGATRIRLMRGGVDIEPATLAPMFLVAAFMTLGLLSFFSKIFTVLLVALTALYLLFVLWCGCLKWRTEKKSAALLISLMIPGMHLSYGLAQWREFFFPDRDLSMKDSAD